MRPATLTPTRSRLTGWMLGVIFRIADAAALSVVSVAAGLAAAHSTSQSGTLATFTPFVIGAVTLAWSLWVVGAYGFSPREPLTRHLTRVTGGFVLAALALTLLMSGFRLAAVPSPRYVQWFCGCLVMLCGLHGVWWSVVKQWRAMGRLTPNIVVVGANANAQRLVEAALKNRDAAVLGVFDDRADRAPRDIAGVAMLGDTRALVEHRIMPYVDKVVITVPQVAQARVRQLIEQLSVLPNEVMLFIDQGPASRAAALSRIADAPLAPVSGAPSNERRALVKRIADLVIGGLALLALAPLMAAIALAIKLDSPGPVFFRQRRHGFNSEEIQVWKFRSMREGSGSGPIQQVTSDDPRVTRVGRILRPLSLDELPQLFNVLTGEMSLVGPRPHAVGMKTGETVSAKLVAEYAHRNRMKPGITGWAAVNGSRGPVDTPELVRRRVALDIEYIERQSLLLDLIIMVRTIPCLLGDKLAVR
jgi:Undecaprenyl-phosphate glucose phosphotransferase